MSLDLEIKYNKVLAKLCLNKLSESEATRIYKRRQLQLLLNKNQKFIFDFLKEDISKNLDNEAELERNLFKFSLVDFAFNLFKFFSLSAYSFLIVGASLFRKTRREKITLFESTLDSLGTTKAFKERLLRDEAFRELVSEPDNLFFSISGNPRIEEEFHHVKRVPFDIPLFLGVDIKDAFLFLILSLKGLFQFLVLICKDYRYAILSKDFSSLAIIEMLDRRNSIKSYVKTGSEYNDQQFWLSNENKNFLFTYIWYSTNTVSIVYDEEDRYYTVAYLLADFQNSVTWSSTHTDWLRKISRGNIQTSDPIIFSQDKEKVSIDSKYVVIFDVKPFEIGFLNDLFLVPESMYYTKESCTSFIENIVEYFQTKKTDLKLVLKTKRKAHPSNIKSYSDLVLELEKSGVLEIVEDVDVFDLIQGSELCLSIPYTSTNNIALSLGKSSAYYNPIGKIQRSCDDGIELCNGKDELFNYLDKLFSQK